MVWKIERSPEAIADLSGIYDFLARANIEYGEPVDVVAERADARVREILHRIDDMVRSPFQGTLRPDIGAGVRNVTKGRAVIYFRPEEETETLHVLAVFWGGQDHMARMTARRG